MKATVYTLRAIWLVGMPTGVYFGNAWLAAVGTAALIALLCIASEQRRERKNLFRL